MLNRWFDFGEGKGGNMVDLGLRLHGCTMSDFLPRIEKNTFSFSLRTPAISHSEDNGIHILSCFAVSSYPLIKYLHERLIYLDIAEKYLREVRYQIRDKTYYASGFKNDAGGYELRNLNFKDSSSPKDTTFIDNGAKEVAVFEGFFNFLSYQSLYDKYQVDKPNFLVLNSASFFEKRLPKMQKHHRIKLFLITIKRATNTQNKPYQLSSKSSRMNVNFTRNTTTSMTG